MLSLTVLLFISLILSLVLISFKKSRVAEEGNSFLPQSTSDEFHPFYRKVKEYQFWQVMFWTLLISIFLTFFEEFDIPFFCPLLLFYFILIFVLTMRKQKKHMIKYHYLPCDTEKIKYNSNK